MTGNPLDAAVGVVVFTLPDGTEYRQVLGNPTEGETHITPDGRVWIAVHEELVGGQIIRAPFTIHWKAAAQLQITTVSLPDGVVSETYGATVAAAGGIAPYTFSVATGYLPAGLSLNATTGAITGSPTTAGIATFTIGVSDSGKRSATRQFSITVSKKDSTTVDLAIESLRRKFGVEFLKLQSRPLPVQVLVVTAQLKDIAPPLTLTRIRLTISEEGVEWTQTNPSDPSSKTLMPE